MDDYDLYPPKPELIEQKQKSNPSLTFFSLVLFVLAFMLVFGDEINFIIYLLIVLLIHEFGHFMAMKFFGYKNVRMMFIPLMGAFVQGKKRNYSQRQSFIVVLSGPIPGMFLGAFLMWYGNYMHSYWLVELSSLFLVLNLVNLLPLDPLDGGQLFKLFIRKNNELFLMIFALISSLMIISLGWILSSTIIILFGFFMAFRVRALQKQFQMHKDLESEDVNYFTQYKLLSNHDFLKIKEVVLTHTPPLRKYVDQVSSEEAAPILASQVNNVLSTPIEKDTNTIFKILVITLWMSSFLLPYLLYKTLDLNWLMSVWAFYD